MPLHPQFQHLSRNVRFIPAGINFHSLQGQAQGTTYSIRYGAATAVMQQADVDSILQSVDRSLSTYNPQSLISLFNARPDGLEVDSHLVKLVRLSKQFHAGSEGSFDITIKPLMELWGFGATTVTHMPDEQAIRKVMRHTGMELLALQGQYLKKKNPKLEIDCNGIAQGYTVDLLADYLEAKGVKDYLVELGGEMRLSGKNEKGEDWTVGIEKPGEPNAPLQLAGTIRPGKGAVTTSGLYRRTRTLDGKRVGHVIDPTTGFPVGNGMIAVTVWAADATTADATDNILMVIGPAAIRPYLDAHPGVEAYWVFRLPDGRVAYGATKGFLRIMEQ